MHVPNLHWILVEDADTKSDLVTSLLSGDHSCKMKLSTHLNIRTLKTHRRGPKDPVWLKNRGVLQRNIALVWLREAWSTGQLEDTSGVVYFGDDDNVYDLRVFEEVSLLFSLILLLHTLMKWVLPLKFYHNAANLYKYKI